MSALAKCGLPQHIARTEAKQYARIIINGTGPKAVIRVAGHTGNYLCRKIYVFFGTRAELESRNERRFVPEARFRQVEAGRQAFAPDGAEVLVQRGEGDVLWNIWRGKAALQLGPYDARFDHETMALRVADEIARGRAFRGFCWPGEPYEETPVLRLIEAMLLEEETRLRTIHKLGQIGRGED